MSINFLHYLLPQPVLLNLGFWQLRWYGVIIALALLIGFLMFKKLAARKNITSDQAYSFVFWLVLGGIIGARLYAVILDWSYYSQNFLEIIKIWHGGLAIHGAVLGGALSGFFWARKNKINFFVLIDLVVAPLILGQAIGRWGNYFNQELFGRPTTWPWGILIAPENRPAPYVDSQYFHPTFLYESILDLGLFFLLLYFAKKSRPAGFLTASYLLGYAIIRFFLEFVRIDEAPMLWGLRVPQWISILLVLIAIGLYWAKNRQK